MIEFWKQPRTIYPSIFRVLIGIVLLLDLISTYSSGTFQFNPEFTHYTNSESLILRENYTLYYITYGLVLILFILGIGKNFISFLVYVFNFLMLFISPYILNWGDVILKFTLLYFVFANSFRFLSIQKSKEAKGIWNYISQLAVWSIILHLFLVYLSNSIYKLSDSDWQQGFAAFYSFSQFPGFESSVFYPVLSTSIAGKIISWSIIAQQLTFIPLILWKKTRYFAIALGIIIHLIMFFQFGLWKFEIIMILHYGFLLNDNEWRKIIPKKILKNQFV